MTRAEGENGPLISESLVELYQRARREARLPATPDAQAVGALNELIAALQGARSLWMRAADSARSADVRDRVLAEGDALEAEAQGLRAAVRDFGGAPPDEKAPAEPLPFSTRDLDYASDDAAIQIGLGANRAHLSETRRRLADRSGLPEDVRAAIAKAPG